MATGAAANANVSCEQEKAMTSAGAVVIPHAGSPMASEIHTHIPHSSGAPANVEAARAIRNEPVGRICLANATHRVIEGEVLA